MKSRFFALAFACIASVPCLQGCSGKTENTVAAPPANAPTEEQMQQQADAYADEAKKRAAAEAGN